jgi:hypothetical protein
MCAKNKWTKQKKKLFYSSLRSKQHIDAKFIENRRAMKKRQALKRVNDWTQFFNQYFSSKSKLLSKNDQKDLLNSLNIVSRNLILTKVVKISPYTSLWNKGHKVQHHKLAFSG